MRTETIERQLYSFNELNDEAKEKALENVRDPEAYLCYDWYDYVYEGFKEYMAKLGIEVEKMYFSGFWSQGDGACFEGYVDDMRKFLWTSGLWREYPHYFSEWDDIRIGVKQSGHYYHEMCTEFTIEAERVSVWEHDLWEEQKYNPKYDDEVYDALSEIAERQWNENFDEFENDVKEFMRDKMRDLYRRLEAEYDWLMSDEVVKDHIDCNEYEFTEDGQLI